MQEGDIFQNLQDLTAVFHSSKFKEPSVFESASCSCTSHGESAAAFCHQGREMAIYVLRNVKNVCVCSRVCLNTHTRFTRALSLIRIHTHSHTNQFSGLVLVEFAGLALHVDFKILDADSTHLQGIECIERKQEHVLQ